MDIAGEHLQRLVTRDFADRRHIQVGVLEQPAGRLVPEVVEVQDLDPGFLAGGLHGLVMAPAEMPNTFPSPLGPMVSRISSALGDSGTVRCSPFFVLGSKAVFFAMLTFSHDRDAISSRRMAVSKANSMQSLSFSLAAVSSASFSPGASLRSLPRLTFGRSTFSVGFPIDSNPHVVRARLKTREITVMSSRAVL